MLHLCKFLGVSGCILSFNPLLVVITGQAKTLKVMDKKEVLDLHLLISEEKRESLYPSNYFGVSCAFFALRLLSVPNKDENWSLIREKMIQGSAQILGLLIWMAQKEWMSLQNADLLHKLDAAKKEIETLKTIRREDAKANEKVVGIFATQEHSWFVERKKLRQHLGGLMNDMSFFEKKKEEEIFQMNENLKEMELLLQSKDRAMEEEMKTRKELEEKLSNAENIVEELRERANIEAQEHSSELWKHKTAFIELVSNQRQLEAEMRRSLRQVEAAKQELDSVLLQKEESVLLVQKLSAEVVRMSKDLEQKDKILSVMLRKSKLDRAEKQMLLNEIKLSKARRKQAEFEMERWKSVSESRHERQSLKSAMSNQLNSRSDNSSSGKARLVAIDHVIQHNHPEFIKEFDSFSPLLDGFNSQANELADVKQLNLMVRSEAEKEALMLLQRHNQEIEAFAEQMRVKDEKLEAFRWQLLSMELETKRLQSHMAGLNQDVLQLRHDNMKLEALSMAREEELTSVKRVFVTQFNASNITSEDEKEEDELETNRNVKVEKEVDIDPNENSLINHVHCPSKELEERNSVACHSPSREDVKLELPKKKPSKTNNTPWRMDLHALGVSFKIKRLKQQLLMLERLAGKQESGNENESLDNDGIGMKDFFSLMSSLNKQAGRYQSLQAKADDLCQRMHESDGGNTNTGDPETVRMTRETRTLETLLEETFQLQRYIVATGQKLMEIKSKISSTLSGIVDQLNKSCGLDVKQFSESLRTHFQEVQRGLEVRIARIIGDLEGTLACEGMICLRR